MYHFQWEQEGWKLFTEIFSFFIFLKGKDCVEYLESVCTADIRGLGDNVAVLTVFTDARGGILDDLIITKIAEDSLYVVSNAARKHHDQQHLLNALVRLFLTNGR